MANIEKYIYKNNQKLRLGYTTGSCAAAAAKAAVQMLLTGKQVSYVELMTPKGISLTLEVLDARISGKEASCAIEKDAGDDPDVTNGIKIYAAVRKCQEPGIHIDGGEGVGRVTRDGLEQPVGSAAINSVPRAMIRKAWRRPAAALDMRVVCPSSFPFRRVWSLPGKRSIQGLASRAASPFLAQAELWNP